MGEQINIVASRDIDVPAERLWAATAEDFGGIEQWIASVSGVTLTPTASGDAVGTNRVCVSPFGETDETMVNYDETARTFGYSIKGLPPIVTNAENNWTISERGENRSNIEMHMSADVVDGADPEMVNGMRAQLNQILNEATDELKHWVEQGTPHPRKVQAMQAS